MSLKYEPSYQVLVVDEQAGARAREVPAVHAPREIPGFRVQGPGFRVQGLGARSTRAA